MGKKSRKSRYKLFTLKTVLYVDDGLENEQNCSDIFDLRPWQGLDELLTVFHPIVLHRCVSQKSNCWTIEKNP